MKFSFFKKLDGHAHEILSKGAVAFVLKIFGTGLTFLFQLAIARYLGASGSGIYFLSLTIITLVATVVRLGMDNSITRFVAAHASENDWAKVKGVVRHALRIALALSIMASAALFFTSDWLGKNIFSEPELGDPLKLMSLAIMPLALMMLYSTALQGLKRTRDALLMQSVLTPLISVASLLVLVPLLGVSGAVLAYGIGVTFTLTFGFWMWRRAGKAWAKVRPKFSRKQLLASSFPLLGSVILQQIMQNLPLLLLGIWGSSVDVGVFGIAQRIAGLVSLGLIAANSIIAPKIAACYHQKDLAGLNNVARHGTLLMLAMAAPALLLFLLVPQWVMGLFGAEFSSGWLLLVIMALGQLVNVLTNTIGFLLVMTGNQRRYLISNIIAAAVGATLAQILIPNYGATGAAIAVAMPLALVNLFGVRYVGRMLKAG